MSDAGNRSGGTDDGGGNVASVTTGTLPTMVITMIMVVPAVHVLPSHGKAFRQRNGIQKFSEPRVTRQCRSAGNACSLAPDDVV